MKLQWDRVNIAERPDACTGFMCFRNLVQSCWISVSTMAKSQVLKFMADLDTNISGQHLLLHITSAADARKHVLER